MPVITTSDRCNAPCGLFVGAGLAGILSGIWRFLGLQPALVARTGAFAVSGARVLPARSARLMVAAACLGLAACGSVESEVESAAKRWLDALNAGNVTAAQEFSTDQTKALLQLASAMGESMAVGKYKIVEVKMSGDTAAQVTIKAENGDAPKTLDLVKIDGNWKVGIRK